MKAIAMNPIPLTSYVSTPTKSRTDLHSLRYEFRHLVNAGLVSVHAFGEFVEWVDRQGGLKAALSRVNGPIDLSA
jgi:hypothetical protein